MKFHASIAAIGTAAGHTVIAVDRQGKQPVRAAGRIRGAVAFSPGRQSGHSHDQGRGRAGLVHRVRLGLPGSYAIWYLADRGHIWTFLGFPTTARGRLRTSGSRPPCRCLSCSYWSAWPSSRRGGCCGNAGAVLALLPAEFAFWIGFALPLGPVAGLARTVLVLRGWSSLSLAPGPANGQARRCAACRQPAASLNKHRLHPARRAIVAAPPHQVGSRTPESGTDHPNLHGRAVPRTQPHSRS